MRWLKEIFLSKAEKDWARARRDLAVAKAEMYVDLMAIHAGDSDAPPRKHVLVDFLFETGDLLSADVSRLLAGLRHDAWEIRWAAIMGLRPFCTRADEPMAKVRLGAAGVTAADVQRQLERCRTDPDARVRAEAESAVSR